MPEPKTSAVSAADLKKAEAELLARKAAYKDEMVNRINGMIAELTELGFTFTFAEVNGDAPKKRTGRPTNVEKAAREAAAQGKQ